MELGPVELTVGDLERSVGYYTKAIGLRLLSREGPKGPRAELGVPGRVIVTLTEGTFTVQEGGPGLSHVAPQLPSRADLARFVRTYAGPMRLIDHTVARSAYVQDPDGYTVEMTCASPAQEWRWQGEHPAAVADPLSLDDFPEQDRPYDGAPDGTELGHVQLKATDDGLAATEAFYCGTLGFAFQGGMAGRFLAVGVVPHRAILVFTNRFGASGVDDPTVTTLMVPALDPVAKLLADHPYERTEDALTTRDPSGNILKFRES